MSETTIEQTLREILEYRCPRYEELPGIYLYSDQLVEALNLCTAPFRTGDEDHILTAAMVNNYVKQHLLPPPEKKRYGREHFALLYCICLLKRAFSISEIQGMLAVQQKTYPFPVAYDYFCTELEKALKATFSTRDFSAPSSAHHMTPESELVRSAALSVAHKLYTAKFLQLFDQITEEERKDIVSHLRQNGR